MVRYEECILITNLMYPLLKILDNVDKHYDTDKNFKYRKTPKIKQNIRTHNFGNKVFAMIY